MPSPESYDQAYRRLADALFQLLEGVTSEDSQKELAAFVAQAVQHLKQIQAETPEFYVGEFLSYFHESVLTITNSELGPIKEAMTRLQAADNELRRDLNSRLSAARAAKDTLAEHEIWKELERRRADTQGEKDALSQRLSGVLVKQKAFLELRAALGY